jgi:hypothetical protein
MHSLHGIHVHGFPNLFVVGLGQAGNLISNVTHNLAEAAETVAAVVGHAEQVGALEVQVTAEAEQAWVDGLAKGGSNPVIGSPDCTPGYYNNEGRAMGPREALNAAGYAGGPVAYFQYIDAWRRSGEFAGLEFRSPEDVQAAPSPSHAGQDD